jgi:hypothetical protein
MSRLLRTPLRISELVYTLALDQKRASELKTCRKGNDNSQSAGAHGDHWKPQRGCTWFVVSPTYETLA